MMDKVTEGLTIMKTIGEQVLRMMDPSDERADRLATCVQEISALVSQVNLGAPQGAGEPMGGMPPPPGNPQTAESEKMV
ncbi:MAG TPA: hypothetical protein VEI97_09020 [bacterium]|nr:hypothetical protein [bacterium]